MNHFLVILLAGASGTLYFVFGQGYWLLACLFAFFLATRFRQITSSIGKFSGILLLFCLTSISINELGIAYPYSLIIILTLLIVLIFYEGPEWSKLFFGPGSMQGYTRFSLILAFFLSLMFGIAIYLTIDDIVNPVPFEWPFDVLIVVALGFALYLAIMEEILFRSFIFERAQSAAGPGSAIAAQAIFFGCMYYKIGIPDGLTGALLGMIFGAALGFLVNKTKSIYLSMLVHAIVTLVVFIELSLLGKILQS